MIKNEELDEWEVEANKARQSAIWEYCPGEFIYLIHAYRQLKMEYDELKFRMDGLEK